MSGWEVGDLALCINNRLDRHDPRAGLLSMGHVYLVAVVGVRDTDGAFALGFRELPVEGNTKRAYAFTARRFVKVTPPAADEFDREVIDLMAPMKEPVQIRSIISGNKTVRTSRIAEVIGDA